MTTTKNNEHKKLNVPNLRFPEFQGEWKNTTIGEIATIKNGPFGSVLHAEDYVDEGMPIVTTEHFKSGNLPLSKNGIPQVSEDDYCRLKGYMLETDDIVFSRVGSVDINAHVEHVQQGWLFSGRVLRVRPIKSVNSLCLHYVLSTESVKRDIRNRAVGQTMPSINTPILSNTGIYMSQSEAEQKKIANLLSIIDERISTQSKIIEDLKKLKCAIIEKHFRQAKLHKYKICDLGVPFSVGSLSKEDLSEEGHECILYGELFTTYDCVINEVKSHTNKIANTTLSQKGDLLFPSSTTVDAVSLISPSVIDIPNVILGGDMFGIHIDKKFNAYYLSYYINLIARKKLAIYAKGSTIIHLHYKDIAKAQLLLPDLCEQDKIAKCMMAEDAKIKVEEQLLTKLEKQKQYLLRQMFI